MPPCWRRWRRNRGLPTCVWSVSSMASRHTSVRRFRCPGLGHGSAARGVGSRNEPGFEGSPEKIEGDGWHLRETGVYGLSIIGTPTTSASASAATRGMPQGTCAAACLPKSSSIRSCDGNGESKASGDCARGCGDGRPTSVSERTYGRYPLAAHVSPPFSADVAMYEHIGSGQRKGDHPYCGCKCLDASDGGGVVEGGKFGRGRRR